LIPDGQKAIGIVRYNGLILGALEVWARQLRRAHPDLHFYLIEPIMLAHEPELLERFCGFILPGSNEGHNKPYAEALLDLDTLESPRVKAYLHVLNFAHEHRLPVLGICGGHQFMGLWHKGDGMTPQDQSDKNEAVEFPAGNLLYWMLLSPQERAVLEAQCVLPYVAFKVERMHQHAIDGRSPGVGLDVVATSRLGTVMGVTDNVHKIGVQFHPEMVAYARGGEPEAEKRYKQLFESFIELVDRAFDAHQRLGCGMAEGCDAAVFEAETYGPYKAVIERMRSCAVAQPVAVELAEQDVI
ncbi:MAG TPA: gamma-glutamyl-gamma-aminobutyrate hydrolase family protein, partial [Opitutales bacterium]|nr:gamma-glutamyl-gamma-aminobutyrate hydrolase family protein [Opitutales bacterium]